MSTTFNLVGWFARVTRASVNSKPVEHKPEAITLVAGITAEEAAKHEPEYWERQADLKAVAYAKYTPYEKKWMLDWQLVEISHQTEVQAA